MTATTNTGPAFACDLTRLSAADRERLIAICRDVFAQASQVRTLPDGYAIGFEDASPELVTRAGEFIALDRQCCGFLRHELLSEPDGGTIWLRLTGAPGAKELIRTDLLGMVPPQIRDQVT